MGGRARGLLSNIATRTILERSEVLLEDVGFGPDCFQRDWMPTFDTELVSVGTSDDLRELDPGDPPNKDSSW